MGIKPTVIHIAQSNGYLCGAKREDWAEKYMGDKFAMTLPRCTGCQLMMAMHPDSVEPHHVVKQEVASLPDLFGDVSPTIDDDDKQNSLEWWAQ